MTSSTPEQRARTNIDRLLEQAGWAVQNESALNLYASRGVAVREFPLRSGHGTADYLLHWGGGIEGKGRFTATGVGISRGSS